MTTPVILIAGWAHAADALTPLADMLASAFTVHCVSPHEPSGSDYASSLVDLLVKQPQPSMVIGWSMGGMIALQTAGLHPALFSGLALISSTARFCADNDYLCGIAQEKLQAMRAGLERAPHRVLHRFYNVACGPQQATVKARNEFTTKAMQYGIPELCRGLDYLEQTDLRPIVKNSHLPTLLIHGNMDEIIPHGASEYLANHLPSARLVTREGAGHNLPITEASSTAEAIHFFIRQTLS